MRRCAYGGSGPKDHEASWKSWLLGVRSKGHGKTDLSLFLRFFVRRRRVLGKKLSLNMTESAGLDSLRSQVASQYGICFGANASSMLKRSGSPMKRLGGVITFTYRLTMSQMSVFMAVANRCDPMALRCRLYSSRSRERSVADTVRISRRDDISPHDIFACMGTSCFQYD
ncbi:unnamed protein product [Heligmosomoides polygyrus]|uniref:Uncharacterized protein n=1 Tax=Heligmosomoides polygyrus TaxID=6339 RepID=A0A183GWC2_HELPZ|nr:unnamed protein product [Heligmosomoides polygyrus]